MYDAAMKQGQELVKVDRESFPSITYDFPNISESGVTWTQLTGKEKKVVLYHPDTQEREVLDPDGGFVSMAGHYMAWVSHPKGCLADENRVCLLVSDLSTPNPKP